MKLTSAQNYIFGHFFIDETRKFLYSRILDEYAYTFPQEYDEFLDQAMEFYHIISIKHLRNTFVTHYVSETFCLENVLSDQRMVSCLIQVLSSPFPERRYHGDIGVHGVWIVHYEREAYNCFYYKLANQLCYYYGYQQGMKRMKEHGITPSSFGTSAADYIEGTMFAIRKEVTAIQGYLQNYLSQEIQAEK